MEFESRLFRWHITTTCVGSGRHKIIGLRFKTLDKGLGFALIQTPALFQSFPLQLLAALPDRYKQSLISRVRTRRQLSDPILEYREVMIFAQTVRDGFCAPDPLCKMAGLEGLEDFHCLSDIFRLLTRLMQIFVGTIGFHLGKRFAAIAVDAIDARVQHAAAVWDTPPFDATPRCLDGSRTVLHIPRALYLAEQAQPRFVQHAPQF